MTDLTIHRLSVEDGVIYWWIPANPKKELGMIKVTYHRGLTHD